MNSNTAPQEIQFDVLNKDDFRVSLVAPVSAVVADIIKVIQDQEPKKFPRTDDQGRPKAYTLANLRTNDTLDPTATLAMSGVHAGDVLLAKHGFISAR